MTKTRSPRALAKAAAYKALPVAKVMSPLKFIRARSVIRDEKGAIAGFEPNYLFAHAAAEQGAGGVVQYIARQMVLDPSYNVAAVK